MEGNFLWTLYKQPIDFCPSSFEVCCSLWISRLKTHPKTQEMIVDTVNEEQYADSDGDIDYQGYLAFVVRPKYRKEEAVGKKAGSIQTLIIDGEKQIPRLTFLLYLRK